MVEESGDEEVEVLGWAGGHEFVAETPAFVVKEASDPAI